MQSRKTGFFEIYRFEFEPLRPGFGIPKDKRSRRLLAQYFQIALSVTYEVRLLGRISVKQDACIGLAPDEFRDRLRMLLEPRMKLFDCPRITRRLVPICIDKIEIERHSDD